MRGEASRPEGRGLPERKISISGVEKIAPPPDPFLIASLNPALKGGACGERTGHWRAINEGHIP